MFVWLKREGKNMKKIIAIAASLLAAACTTQDASPLIFAQGITVGISVGSSATNAATPEFVVGLKQANIAIVPTVIPKDIPLPEKQTSRNIRSFSPEDGKDTDGAEDALSTFGSFSNQTSSNCVTLGVFFATGVAAQNISKGLQEKTGTTC
jgi:hypothetical protein